MDTSGWGVGGLGRSQQGEQTQFMSLPRAVREHREMIELSVTGIC